MSSKTIMKVEDVLELTVNERNSVCVVFSRNNYAPGITVRTNCCLCADFHVRWLSVIYREIVN